MSVDYLIPEGLPPGACRHIRQERHWLLKPSVVGYTLGVLTCAKHGIALGDDVEKCKRLRGGACWYVPGNRSARE